MDITGRPPPDPTGDTGPEGDVRKAHDAPADDAPGARTSVQVLLALAVCGAVAIATHGLRLIPPAVPLAGRWLQLVRLGGVAALATGVVVLVRQRRAIRREGARGPDPTVGGLRTAATIMGVLAVVALTANPLKLHPVGIRGGPAFSLGPSPRSGGGRPGGIPGPSGSIAGHSVMGGGPAELGDPGLDVTVPGDDGFAGSPLQRIARALLPLLLLMVAALAFRSMTRKPAVHFEIMVGSPVARADAEAGLAASLVEIAGDSPDPRHQITAAYHRLLAALAAAGAPRRPQEAPHEYLHRALAPLGVRPDALHRLTDLYVLAQFSERPITARHREAAAEAYDASLADLRGSRHTAAAGAPGARTEAPA